MSWWSREFNRCALDECGRASLPNLSRFVTRTRFRRSRCKKKAITSSEFCNKISVELDEVRPSPPPDIKLDLIVSQASGVVRTGRLTAACAASSRISAAARRLQRFMQSALLLISEVITFIVGNQIDNCPFG